MPPRDPQQRAADRQTATGLVDVLKDRRRQLRAEIKKLPAPASRTPAQRRDALIMRSLADIIQSQLVGWGVADAADRETTEE